MKRTRMPYRISFLRGRGLRRPSASAIGLGLLALVSLLLATGCSELERRERPPFSAVWVTANAEPLTASQAARMKEGGVEENYVSAARLDATDLTSPLKRFKLPELPAGMPTTMAIHGDLPALAEDAAESLALAVAEAARQIRFDVESRGGLVVGLHFDLLEVSDAETYGALLRGLRRELGKDLYLSATFARQWIGRKEYEPIAAAVDYLVAFAYGQRVDEEESADAWDFAQLERELEVLEELSTPYQIGVVTLGTITHLSGNKVKARTTRATFQEVLWNRRLKLGQGFTLEGANRRVISMSAERRAKVGEWQLAVGDGLRIVRSATSDLEELMRLTDVWQFPNYLGLAFYRLPSSEERLSLNADSLINALSPEPAEPDLLFDISVQRRTGRGWLVRFSITNRNGELTELALLDTNYIQVTAPGGYFGSRVKAGDFYRYDLYQRQGQELKRTFRQADVLRLHVPMLVGEHRVASGDVEVVASGAPVLDLEAKFLLSDGRILEVGPLRWQDGSFADHG